MAKIAQDPVVRKSARILSSDSYFKCLYLIMITLFSHDNLVKFIV